MFEPIKSKKIHQQVSEEIQKMILKGDLKLGDKLPAERKMAEMLDVSRTSVREALRSLEILGIIESRQGEGNFISENFDHIGLEPLSLIFTLKNGKFRDILEIRNTLEIEAAGLAAERITEERKEVLEELLEKLINAENESERVEIDKAIHYKIAEYTNNVLILNVLETISALMSHSIEDARLKIVNNLKIENLLEEMHKNIVISIVSGDRERARKAMKEHFDNVYLSIQDKEEFDN
jgi:GntR family transcriptional repressor for pyruvate dehydrogenase complex